MKKSKQFFRFLRAVWNGEPTGHINDLWGEFTGRLVLCGKPPNEYLMVKACTRQAPHVCKVNGPCNGWPKENYGSDN